MNILKTAEKSIFSCLLFAIVFGAFICGAQPINKIAIGSYHSLVLKNDGSLWAMGDNSYGQLGDNTYISTNLPECIVLGNVTAVAAGNGFSLFLKSDGSLWGMGNNRTGQLGDGTTNNVNHPKQILVGTVTAIAAGDGFSLILKSDGSLWGMGNNRTGQLGDGTTNNVFLPEQIVASNVTAIAAGGHSLFIKGDGSLWVMGNNGFGELGDGTFNNSTLPEQIVSSNVTAIAAGEWHSLFLKVDGSLWAMGRNWEGELGNGDYAYANVNQPEQILAGGVTSIAAGNQHSLCLMVDNSLWAMGCNDDGQLGDGTYSYSSFYPLGVVSPEMIETGGVKAIAAGLIDSLFAVSDGSLWGMGGNVVGELGDGSFESENSPEQIISPVPLPKITTQPLNQTNNSGSNVAFTVTATGTGNLNFQWQKNGTNLLNGGKISGVYSNQLSIVGISDSDVANTPSLSVILMAA